MNTLAIAALAMHDDLSRMATISQNLANSSTVGYKRKSLIGNNFAQHLQSVAASNVVDAYSPSAIGTAPTIQLDQTQGSLRHTANPLDIAIEGDGYFELATPSGPMYTRHGSFHVDIQGRLTSHQGLAVMGEAGEIIATNAPLAISSNGEVRQNGDLLGRIKLVQFDNPHSLQPHADGLYAQGTATSAQTKKAVSLKSGFLENSNVNSPQEMIKLVETVRHFEAMQKIVLGYDDLLEKTLRKLGEF